MTSNGNLTISGSFICGGFSGLLVGLATHPLDTLKTRLQSEAGFHKSGGFAQTYAGISSATVGYAPGAAVFFLTYESVKRLCSDTSQPGTSTCSPVVHSVAAGAAEVAANLVRVPAEVVKQRAQASELLNSPSSWQVTRKVAAEEGFLGFYRGFSITVFRGLPCVVLQFPMWEFMKQQLCQYQQKTITPAQSALCGATAGVIGGALTLPLDVAKTRIMLSESQSGANSKPISQSIGSMQTMRTIYQDGGLSALYSGGLVRSVWMFTGSLIFFGAYEQSKVWYLRFNTGKPDLELINC